MSKLILLATLYYLLPPQFLFNEDMMQRQKLKIGLNFTETVTLYNEKFPQGIISFRERVYLKTAQPPLTLGRLRIETSYPDALKYKLRFLIDESSQLWDLNDGTAVAREKLPASEWWLLFYLYQDVGSLTSALELLGFNTVSSKLDKLGNRSVYRLENVERKRILWFDKELLHPLGYSYEFDGKIWSVRWDSVAAFNDGIYFPQEIQITMNDQLVEKRQISTQPHPNQQLGDELFLRQNLENELTNNPPGTDQVKFIKQLRAQ